MSWLEKNKKVQYSGYYKSNEKQIEKEIKAYQTFKGLETYP